VLWRFSLYGLLKNQRYFEAFLVLAFVERGLSFSQIGLLVGLRELTANLLEIPSGALADLLGRRRCMVTAFAAYVAAYLLLGLLVAPWAMAAGMLLIGCGDAFRSGTHKAMIFDWLAEQGRPEDRVRVYGSTRSWSQVGSAVAVPIAAGVVLWRGGYDDVFWLSAIPAALNLVNLATYPRSLEGTRPEGMSVGDAARELWRAARALWPRRPLRRLLVEAAAFSGTYRALKDYLQPLLQAAALGLPFWVVGEPSQRTAVLLGAVYVLLFLLSAVAARGAHRLVTRAGSEDRAAGWIRGLVVGVFVAMLVGTGLQWRALGVAAFVLLALVHNLFRPVLVARFDQHAPAELGATVLSVESQASSLAAVVLAPLLGLAVDLASGGGIVRIWPVAAAGLLLSGAMWWAGSRSHVTKPRRTSDGAS